MTDTKTNMGIPSEIVWAAACTAQRLNGEYIKDTAGGKEPNKKMILDLINCPEKITDIDREQGRIVREYYKGLTFKILQGKKLSEFIQMAIRLAYMDTIEDKIDIAMISSLPQSYMRSSKWDEQERRLQLADGGFVGTMGDKVELNIEVVRSVYSGKYNVFFISGLTDNNQAVLFGYKQDLNTGESLTIRGTVNGHNDNSTRLTMVKICNTE